jgi:hypothetical protein
MHRSHVPFNVRSRVNAKQTNNESLAIAYVHQFDLAVPDNDAGSSLS